MSASRARGSRELTTVSWWLPENVMDAGSVTKWQVYFDNGPATTSRLVKHIRLEVPLRYDGKPRVLLHNIVKWSVSD